MDHPGDVQLLGGRSRAAVEVYSHAAGATAEETLDRAEELLAEGYRHIRLQVGGPGPGTYDAPGTRNGYPRSPHPDGWDVNHYLAATPALFAAARERLGDRVSLMHDVHSRLTPKQAVVLARALEPYRLSFLEDVVPPEHYDRLPEVRAASPVPIAVGEQIGSVTDAVRLVREGGVDLLRLHTSSVGGLTPTRKLVALAELLGVRTAFHSPGDISPVGVAANLAVDVSTPAFGYQESHTYNEATHEVFPGTRSSTTTTSHPRNCPGGEWNWTSGRPCATRPSNSCTSAGPRRSAAPTAGSRPRNPLAPRPATPQPRNSAASRLTPKAGAPPRGGCTPAR